MIPGCLYAVLSDHGDASTPVYVETTIFSARSAPFEALCCEMTGAAHAVAVNNGTTALVAALEALQLQPGDEVVTAGETRLLPEARA